MKLSNLRNMVCCLAAISVLAGCSVNPQPGSGTKIGQIVKVSQVGIFSKTYEAELIRGGFSNGGGVNGTTFHFTIPPELLGQAQECLRTQREVVLTYETEFISSSWRTSSGNNFAVKIEPKAAEPAK